MTTFFAILLVIFVGPIVAVLGITLAYGIVAGAAMLWLTAIGLFCPPALDLRDAIFEAGPFWLWERAYDR